MKQRNFTILSWFLVAISILLPLGIWGGSVNWQIANLTLFQLFPLFGLFAWMIMWTHYVTGAIRLSSQEVQKPRFYAGLTAYLVLISLLLHPGLLAYGLWDVGGGFPPTSFLGYVGEAMKVAVISGSIALTIFLSFEVFDRIKEKRLIKKYWLIVSFSQSLAMVLIFFHGLQLGSHISSGWFYYVWIAYGVILLPCFYIIHRYELAHRRFLRHKRPDTEL